MTIKLNSLTRWLELEQNGVINFEGATDGGERRVRLHLNCEAQTALFFENTDGPRFLTTVEPGLTTIEFGAVGPFSVFPEEMTGAVQYQTADGEPTFATIADPQIFTKIANRRHRNPELEEMMMRMQLNMERRLATQASEIEAAFERRRKEDEHGRAAERVETNAPGAVASAAGSEVSAQEPSQPGPVENPGSADGSQQPSA